MTYRELLELYKQGKLEEEKRKEVEADIEKQDAISEYLFEEGTVPGIGEVTISEDLKPSLGETSDTDSEHAFIKTIQQTIRRAFVKMGVIVGAVLLAILLFVIFALPHVVSLFYYDPGKIVASDSWSDTNQMTLDMAVYTELFIPGYQREKVTVTDRGYGTYDICIVQNTSLNGNFTNVSGIIQRNHLVLYDTNLLKRPSDNVFIRTEDTPGHYFTSMQTEDGETVYVGAAGTPAYAQKKLQELSEDTMYVGYLTLSHLMSYEDFMAWFEAQEAKFGSLWCSVYLTSNVGSQLINNVGFDPYGYGSTMAYDEECYPYLRPYSEKTSMPKDAKSIQTHFVSMLQYMHDNPEFLEMMNPGLLPNLDFAIKAVEKQGLQLNGFVITADKETLLKLSEDENVCYVYTNPLK